MVFLCALAIAGCGSGSSGKRATTGSQQTSPTTAATSTSVTATTSSTTSSAGATTTASTGSTDSQTASSGDLCSIFAQTFVAASAERGLKIKTLSMIDPQGVTIPAAERSPAQNGGPEVYSCTWYVVMSSWSKPAAVTPNAKMLTIGLAIWMLDPSPEIRSEFQACSLEAPTVAPSPSTTEYPSGADSFAYDDDMQQTTLDSLQKLTGGNVEEFGSSPCMLEGEEHEGSGLTDGGQTWFAFLVADGGTGTDFDVAKLPFTQQVLAQSLVEAGFDGHLPALPHAG